jgi:hypothetical protein
VHDESCPYLCSPYGEQVIRLAYFFDAFGLALARFSFRTDGRVARGLTGALAR